MRAEQRTFTDLENFLFEKGIDPRAIAINKTPIDNQYCIQWDGKSAEVFYFERGLKMGLLAFEERLPAMEHFQAIVLADRSAYLSHETDA